MRIIHAMTAAAALGVAGCSSESGGPQRGTAAPASRTLTGAEQAKVDKAAAVALAIEASPEAADRILREHGLTEQEFEGLLFAIAAHPAMSDSYNAKLGP